MRVHAPHRHKVTKGFWIHNRAATQGTLIRTFIVTLLHLLNASYVKPGFVTTTAKKCGMRHVFLRHLLLTNATNRLSASKT
jgi:hypothetical protein